jgi:acetyl-CoA acetyltransferase
MPYITGVACTPFGRHEGSTALSLITLAARDALHDAQLATTQIDGLLTGYATTFPHLMLANVVAEHLGIQPDYCHAIQSGGASGLTMVMLARELIRSGRCKNVLCVAGENRLTGQTRDMAIQALSQVGHADFEVPFGPTVPAYYALLAARYLHEHNLSERDLAEFAVLMRSHAIRHPGAHQRDAIDVDVVLKSKTISTPLKLLDCCPISDGAAAVVVSLEPTATKAIRIRGAGQAHRHQHVSQIKDIHATGAKAAADLAFREAHIDRAQIEYLGIYDSFTITLMMLLEEIGFASRGEAASKVRDGEFSAMGKLPLNTHGGLLSYGHCGVAGGMAHLVEAVLQLSGDAGTRQIAEREWAYVHADGGVMSAHVGMILQRER